MANQVAGYTLRKALWAGSWILASAFVLSFLVNVLRLTGPLFMLLIYDRVLASRSEETLVALFILVVTFLLVMGLLDYSRRRLLARFGAQFQERLELQILVDSARDKFFVAGRNKPASGLGELDGLRGFFHSYALIAIFDFVWAPMFLVVVFSFNSLLGWVAVGGVAVLTALTMIRALTSKGRDARAKAASDTIGNLKDIMRVSIGVVRGQQMTAPFKTRWLHARQHSRDKSVELKDYTTWFEIFSKQVRMLAQYSVLAVGAYLTVKGQLSIGAMVASTFLVLRVLHPVEQFLTQVPKIRRAFENWANLNKILDAQARGKYEDNSIKLESSLSMSSVYARSPVTGNNVLKAVNLSVSPGQLIQIEGGSGAGKSMLAETIIGAWPKSAGSILCGGSNMERLTSEKLANFFGYVPETAAFVQGTIKENIARLELDADTGKVHRAAERAGVHDFIMALAKGYDTDIIGSDVFLSKGQNHQIALARALYGEPNILVIDEPDDGFLRDALAGELASTFDELKRNGCSVIILSRKSLSLPNCDARYLLEFGRLKSLKLAKDVVSFEAKKAEQKVTELRRG